MPTINGLLRVTFCVLATTTGGIAGSRVLKGPSLEVSPNAEPKNDSITYSPHHPVCRTAYTAFRRPLEDIAAALQQSNISVTQYQVRVAEKLTTCHSRGSFGKRNNDLLNTLVNISNRHSPGNQSRHLITPEAVLLYAVACAVKNCWVATNHTFYAGIFKLLTSCAMRESACELVYGDSTSPTHNNTDTVYYPLHHMIGMHAMPAIAPYFSNNTRKPGYSPNQYLCEFNFMQQYDQKGGELHGLQCNH